MLLSFSPPQNLFIYIKYFEPELGNINFIKLGKIIQKLPHQMQVTFYFPLQLIFLKFTFSVHTIFVLVFQRCITSLQLCIRFLKISPRSFSVQYLTLSLFLKTNSLHPLLRSAPNATEIYAGRLATTVPRGKERVNTTWSFPVIKWPPANS